MEGQRNYDIKNIDIPIKDPPSLAVPKDQNKIKKLEMLRQNILEQEKKDKVKREAKKDKEKKSKVDFYSQKLYRFLVSSFLMNLALEPFYLYSLTYDYIISYFDNGEKQLSIYSYNVFHLFFYGFKILGIIFGGKVLLKGSIEKENTAQKTFSLLLIFSSLSIFISTKILPSKNFYLFTFFYSGLPGFLTGPISLFYIINIARLGKKENMNFKLIFSYSCFATIGNYFLVPLISTLCVNYRDNRPALVNIAYGERSILQPIYFEIGDMPERLIFVAIYISVAGFAALFTLYGLDWKAKEVPTMDINWLEFDLNRHKGHKSDPSTNIKLSDIIDYFEFQDNNSDDYTLVMDEMSVKSKMSMKSEYSQRSSKIHSVKMASPYSGLKSGRTSRPGEKVRKKEKIIVTMGEKIEQTYLKILFNESMVFLILCLACVFTVPFYFASKTRALNLRTLFVDSKSIPIMLSESVISGVLNLLNVLLFYYIKSHKYSLIIHIFYSLAFVLVFDFFLDFTFGVIFISIFYNFLLTNAQIMMTVMMTITVTVAEIPNFLPAIYSSQLLAQVALYYGNFYHGEKIDSLRNFFIGCMILAIIFVYGVKTRKLRKMIQAYDGQKRTKAKKKEKEKKDK